MSDSLNEFTLYGEARTYVEQTVAAPLFRTFLGRSTPRPIKIKEHNNTETETMGDLWKSVRTFLIIYGVSATFFWPGIACLILWGMDKVVGGWIGHVVVALLVLVYCKQSYGPRPEKRFGNAWNNLNKWWPVSHDYFPVRLWVWDGKSCTCEPSKAHQTAMPGKYILTLHPHGPFPLSASVLMPQLAKFGHTLDDMFHKVRFAAASAVFFLPLVRDMYLWLGCIEANRKTLTRCLDNGYPIAIFPGGEHEQLLVCSDDSPFEDVIAPTDGLLKLAISTNTQIVPAFSFGERRAFHSSTFMLSFRKYLVKKFRIGIPWAWGRHFWFPFVPYGVPINIVIGKPLELPKMKLKTSVVVTEQQKHQEVDVEVINELRKKYIAAMTELYENYKKLDEVACKKQLRWIPVSTSSRSKDKKK
jgi:hypothetical protein